MNSLDQLQEGFNRALYSLGEGWQQLRQRAANAITRFTPRRGGGDLETADEQWIRHAASWGLLAAEVTEDRRHYVVHLEAPGMEPDDFDIQVADRRLVISGEKRLQREQRGDRYHVMECAYGHFERALPLPGDVDESRTTARYRRGVLTVTLPKLHPANPNRITVKVKT